MTITQRKRRKPCLSLLTRDSITPEDVNYRSLPELNSMSFDDNILQTSSDTLGLILTQIK